MDSTAPIRSPATDALIVTPSTLVTAFATIRDPRREASVEYPLSAILGLAVAALLCAQTSVLAMAEWGARQPADLLHSLGFTKAQTPCQSTLHRLFRKLDPQALAMALMTAFTPTATPRAQERGAKGTRRVPASTGRHSGAGCSMRRTAPPSIPSSPSAMTGAWCWRVSPSSRDRTRRTPSCVRLRD